MHKILCCVAVLAVVPAISVAQTFESEKFNWAWQGQMDVGGLKISQSGNLCISKEMTKQDLAKAFRGYDDACEILGWNPQGETTYFALSCRGDQSTDLAGQLTVAKDVAELKLIGNVHLADKSELVTNGAISANWTGECSVPTTVEADTSEDVDIAAASDEEAELVIEPAVLEEGSDAAGDAEISDVSAEQSDLLPLAEPVDVPDAPIVEPTLVSEEVL